MRTVLGWNTSNAYPEVRWLVEISEAVGYVVAIISALFGGRGTTRSYNFTFPPEPMGRSTLLVTAYYVGGRGRIGVENGSWRKW